MRSPCDVLQVPGSSSSCGVQNLGNLFERNKKRSYTMVIARIVHGWVSIETERVRGGRKGGERRFSRVGNDARNFREDCTRGMHADTTSCLGEWN